MCSWPDSGDAALPLGLHSLGPCPTYPSQALAFALWALFALVTQVPARGPCGRCWPHPPSPQLGPWGPGALPASLALAVLGTLRAAGVTAAGSAGIRARPDAEALFIAFAWA